MRLNCRGQFWFWAVERYLMLCWGFLQTLFEGCTFAPREPQRREETRVVEGFPCCLPDLIWDLLGFARELCWGLDRLTTRSLPLSVPFLPRCLVLTFLWSSLCCGRGDSCSTHIPRGCACRVSSWPWSQRRQRNTTAQLPKVAPSFLMIFLLRPLWVLSVI